MRPLSLVRPGVMLAVAAVLACSSPIEVCACSPAPDVLPVAGTVQTADGALVVGALVSFVAMPEAHGDLPWGYYGSSGESFVTAPDGSFRGRALSFTGIGPHVLRASVVRPPATDTVHVVLGVHAFHVAPGDSARVTVTLP